MSCEILCTHIPYSNTRDEDEQFYAGSNSYRESFFEAMDNIED